MRTTVRQLYGTGTASGDNVANLDFAKRGFITAIQAAIAWDCTTDGVIGHIELSMVPSFQGSTNDVLGPMMQLKTTNNLVTSGMTNTGFPAFVSGIAIPVEPGMKAYINASLSGTVTYRVTFLLYVTTR